MRQGWRINDLFNHFQVEAERTEAVIATDHGTHGVLHPAIIEVAFAPGQGLYELPHGGPGRWAHALGTLAVQGYPLLAFPYITGVLDWVFVLGHQVVIDALPDGGDADFVHVQINEDVFSASISGISRRTALCL